MPQDYLRDEFLFPLVFKNSVEGMLVTDSQGKIIQVNPSCLASFGYKEQEILNKPVEQLIPANLRQLHVQHREAYAKAPKTRYTSHNLEISGLHKSGIEIPLEISLSYVKSQLGLLVICFIIDVSGRKRLEFELRKERKLIRQYLHVTNSVFLVLGKDEQIIMINRAGSRLLGMPKEELVGKNWFNEFIPIAERRDVRELFDRMMNNEIGLTLFKENQIIGNKGGLRLIAWQSTLLRDKSGQPEATLSSGVDITEIRALEREKTEALVMGQENERKRLAQELHDGLGQSISAIGINLNALEPELRLFNEKFQKIYVEIREKLYETIEEVRTISHNLTPRILEDFGLEHALRQMCETIDKSAKVKLSLNTHGNLAEAGKAQALGLYRITQELVNNALRHANPKNINVHVTRGESEWVVLVGDDGDGFDPATKPVGMGLRNIRSRAELLNGDVHIDSNEKSGTTVSIKIPL